MDYNQTLNQFRKFVKLHGVRKVKEDIKDLDLNFYDELFGHGMKPIKVVPAIMRNRGPQRETEVGGSDY